MCGWNCVFTYFCLIDLAKWSKSEIICNWDLCFGNVGVGTNERPLLNNLSSSMVRVMSLRLCIVRLGPVVVGGLGIKNDLVWLFWRGKCWCRCCLFAFVSSSSTFADF